MLLGNTTRRSLVFAYGAITVYGAAFQTASTNNQLGNSLEELPSLLVGPTTPLQHRRQAVPLQRFRLFPFRSPLLRECSLFLQLLRCFSSLAYLRMAYVFNHG